MVLLLRTQFFQPAPALFERSRRGGQCVDLVWQMCGGRVGQQHLTLSRQDLASGVLIRLQERCKEFVQSGLLA